MRIETLFLPFVITCVLFLSACGGNPAWNGPDDSEDKVLLAAEKACECIYETIDREDGHNVGKLVEQLPAWEKALKGEKVPTTDVDEVMKLMEREPAIAETIDNGTCMQAVEEDIFNKGIDFEKMLEVLDQHCVLSMFYD